MTRICGHFTSSSPSPLGVRLGCDLGFVSDDHGLITHPVTGIGQQSVGQIFSLDLWHFQDQVGLLPPLMMLSLKLDHVIFGDWAGRYHLLPRLAPGCVWLIGRLFGQLLGEDRGALAAGIYALHPLLSEQVAFICPMTAWPSRWAWPRSGRSGRAANARSVHRRHPLRDGGLPLEGDRDCRAWTSPPD